jgi:hypothetical protein
LTVLYFGKLPNIGEIFGIDKIDFSPLPLLARIKGIK